MYCCICFLMNDWWWYTSHYVRHGYIRRKSREWSILIEHSKFWKTLGRWELMTGEKLLELHSPLTLGDGLNECIEVNRYTRVDRTSECRDGTERTALQLVDTLDVLLDSVLILLHLLHRLAQRRRDLVQPLRKRGRRDAREAEEHHVREHLDLVAVVAQPRDDADEELVEIEFREAGVQERVHRLVRRLARVQPLVDFVCPGTHLDGLDELGLHDCLFVELR